VEQATSSAYTEILYGPGGRKLALINGQTQAVNTVLLPLPGAATAVYNASGLARYRHSDWLGSSRLSSTTTRTVYYDSAYSPMGESYAETGTTDRNFTGQNQDLAGDLYDFPAREYHPAHGRWISPDPAGIKAVKLTKPRTWNRYAYVAGNPLNSVDPEGLCGDSDLTSGDCDPDESDGGDPEMVVVPPFPGPTPEPTPDVSGSDHFNATQNAPPQATNTAAYAAQSLGIDTYTTAPNNATNYLSQTSGIYQADIGAFDEAGFASLWNSLFWAKYAQKNPTQALVIQNLSGGAITVSNGVIQPAIPKGSLASPLGAPLTLPFAPGPTFTQGKCPTGQHWQFDSSNSGAGGCYLNVPSPLPSGP
jgi:RHS repeat-associated protein